ncbi:MAG: hypothetical protein JWM68_1664 [Verrucomicrobiales bacterium]|nr:hypothetical protein [Verrucomicrobiales bacterium]
MNAKLLLKTLFLIAILFLLVLMGMYNNEQVSLSMPKWILPKKQIQPAAIMYFGFFGIGVLTGTILTAGGKKGASKTNKVEK